MINHDEAFDSKFAPEFGQGDEEESTEVETYEEEDDSEEYEEDDESYESDEDYDESDLEEEEQQESVPLSRYNELRKFATQRSMELADLKRSLLAPAPPVAAPQPKQPNPITRALDDIVAEKVNARLEEYLAPIREQEEELAVQSEIISLAERDPDFGNVSPIFLRQLESSPQLFDIEGGLEIAYRAAKAEYLEKVASARVKAETEQAMKRRAMKEDRTDSSSYARPSQSKAKSEADIIRESILGLGVRRAF